MPKIKYNCLLEIYNCLLECSSAESREYMLTYFWGMGAYFYWGDGSIDVGGGDESKSLGG